MVVEQIISFNWPLVYMEHLEGDELIVCNPASKGILIKCVQYQQYPSGFYNSLLPG